RTSDRRGAALTGARLRPRRDHAPREPGFQRAQTTTARPSMVYVPRVHGIKTGGASARSAEASGSTKVTMPQLGESVVEGTIGKWPVAEGDAGQKDQPIVEILTDKADSEVPSPVAGVVTRIAAKVDEVVSVGGVLCEIEEGASAGEQPPAPAEEADE